MKDSGDDLFLDLRIHRVDRHSQRPDSRRGDAFGVSGKVQSVGAQAVDQFRPNPVDRFERPQGMVSRQRVARTGDADHGDFRADDQRPADEGDRLFRFDQSAADARADFAPVEHPFTEPAQEIAGGTAWNVDASATVVGRAAEAGMVLHGIRPAEADSSPPPPARAASFLLFQVIHDVMFPQSAATQKSSRRLISSSAPMARNTTIPV
ncbi:hypothetical protein SDC9_174865 [bioreactor metagenome]|uniref:Uncharacterized protein n=1 Tax=bioreactor metagenome TaxID=1076179 RepID=A0A645GNF9_9ZZZZ